MFLIACPTDCDVAHFCEYNDVEKEAECTDIDCSQSYVYSDGHTSCEGEYLSFVDNTSYLAD